MNKALRQLALDLLDDEHGINPSAWDSLADFLSDEGNEDIVNAVDGCEGRYYLTPEKANALREAVLPDDDDEVETDFFDENNS